VAQVAATVADTGDLAMLRAPLGGDQQRGGSSAPDPTGS